MDIIANSNNNKKNLVIPLNLSYSVIGENDFIESGLNNSLTYENIYNKILYLNLNLLNERNRLINFDEIPSEYIAIFVGAVSAFSFHLLLGQRKNIFKNEMLTNI